jgi:hypothetical protein
MVVFMGLQRLQATQGPRDLSQPTSGFVEDALVAVFLGGDDVVGAEFFLGVDAGGLAIFAAAIGMGQEFDGVSHGFFYIAGFHQESMHTLRFGQVIYEDVGASFDKLLF